MAARASGKGAAVMANEAARSTGRLARSADEAACIAPQPGPQSDFLSSDADIVIYGGAAGGGKTYALLLEALRNVDVPGFGAVIFRRNANQVLAQGGLWDTSRDIYSGLGRMRLTPTPRWEFPSGARISFACLEDEAAVLKWQGSQIALICFDELTHFSRAQFFYMLSRNRSTCGVRPYVRATCNPDSESWVASLISWWIDGGTGYPIPERSGRKRYMLREGDELCWADSADELRARFAGTPYADIQPKSVAFIAATLSDNRILMERDPGYMANLMALPTVERERLLGGNWKIRPAAGAYFGRARVNMLERAPDDVLHCVRAWDLAAGEERAGSGAAYTAGVLLGLRKGGRYAVLDVINRRMSAGDVRACIAATAAADRARWHNVRIRMNQDPGQAGKDQAEQYLKLLSGYPVSIVRESGSKTARAEPFSAQWQGLAGSEKGNVDIVAGEWNEAYLAQLESFPDSRYKDMVDASATAFNELAGAKQPLPLGGLVLNAASRWRT
jgi:predicted phage terminase large subunit-like protein